MIKHARGRTKCVFWLENICFAASNAFGLSNFYPFTYQRVVERFIIKFDMRQSISMEYNDFGDTIKIVDW